MRRIHLAIMLATITFAVAACSTLGVVAGLLGIANSSTAGSPTTLATNRSIVSTTA